MTFLSRNLRSGADLPPSRSRKGRSARYRWHHFWPEPPHQGRSAHQPRRWLHRGPERFSLGRHGGRSQDGCVAVSIAPMFSTHSFFPRSPHRRQPYLSILGSAWRILRWFRIRWRFVFFALEASFILPLTAVVFRTLRHLRQGIPLHQRLDD